MKTAISFKESMMEMKVLAITGGYSGIGLATTSLFIERGYKVAVMGRSEQGLDSLKEKYGDQVLIFQGDVTKLADIEMFYQFCIEKWGRLDVVVANAGIAEAQNVEAVTEASFDKSFNVNVKGVFFTVQKAIPFLKIGASIILISSIQAQKGAGVWSVYGATKAAVRSLGRSFAEQLSPQGIRVNVLSPGVTQTPIFDKFGFEEGVLSNILQQVTAATPLRRIGSPNEIANAILFLASDEASFVSGADFQVDGGLAQI
nr:SDR family oxidoreductase [Hydrogenovibrio sp. JE_KL2]